MARYTPFLAVLALACAPTGQATGPIRLTDVSGHQTTLAAPARRIVSLVPATTELLFALGAGDRLVGRTKWCDYPAAAAAVASVGDGMQPSVEAILALEPDLVVAYRSAGNRGAVDRLRELGIPTVELATDRIGDLDPAVALLGAATARGEAAESLLAGLRSGLAAASVTRERPPTVFLLTWTQPAITLGAGSFLSEIVERAGGTNLFSDDERPSFVVSIETVVARNPDFILVVGDEEPGWLERPEWQVVPAVQARRLLRVSGSEFNRPSPRAPNAVAALARAIDARWP